MSIITSYKQYLPNAGAGIKNNVSIDITTKVCYIIVVIKMITTWISRTEADTARKPEGTAWTRAHEGKY